LDVSGFTRLSQTTDNATLTVTGSFNGIQRILLENTSATISAGAGFRFNNDTGLKTQLFLGSTVYTSGANTLFVDGVSSRIEIGSRTSNVDINTVSLGVANTKLRVFNNGNVGVGPNPTDAGFKLDVTGTFRSTLDANINGLTVGKGGGGLSNNVAGGQTALSSNTTGNRNVAIGHNAMILSTGANDNVAIGNNVLSSMTGIAANANIVAIGHNAMLTKTGLADSNNVVIGSNAMADGGGTGGQNNVAVGTQSLRNNQTGTRNVSIGFQTMRNPTTSSNNVAIGVQALHNVSTGGANIGLGNTAGFNITTGSNNVVIGSTFATSIATLSNFMLFCDGAGNERFRIPSTGNVLIGTTTDSGYLLDVNGTARVQNNSGTSLYIGSSTLVSTTTPALVNLGGSYGNNATGNVGNMKLTLVDVGATNKYGFGVDGIAGILEFQSTFDFGFYTGNLATRNEVLRIKQGGNVGIGTASPNASALLDVSSTTKGFLPPRMTGAQAELIGTPAAGLLVYSTDGSGATITSLGWWGYNGTTWVKLN
jgi:hypothetical protein